MQAFGSHRKPEKLKKFWRDCDSTPYASASPDFLLSPLTDSSGAIFRFARGRRCYAPPSISRILGASESVKVRKKSEPLRFSASGFCFLKLVLDSITIPYRVRYMRSVRMILPL